jgi:diaminopimelate decarboxylase
VAVVERNSPPQSYDVVGPVCESSDVLGTNRPLAVEPGDVLAILAAGAYGMSMASNYNSRPRPAEVLIDGDRALEVRAREDTQALFALEKRLADAQAR